MQQKTINHPDLTVVTCVYRFSTTVEPKTFQIRHVIHTFTIMFTVVVCRNIFEQTQKFEPAVIVGNFLITCGKFELSQGKICSGEEQ